MALHPDFPHSPYEILDPETRWFPATEELCDKAYEKLLPQLVARIRAEVTAWRDAAYAGASPTSRALLNWWFGAEHLIKQADSTLAPFRYYFAQREAVETVIWLYDVRKVRDKFDLLRFDASGAASSGMFPEDWPRYVIKMATGAGKTKVLSLLIAWSYFHKLYEPDSPLSRNFLLIAPNIIVLDRLRADFDGLRIFFNDPILPDNGFEGQNWRDDFQITLHIQDDVRVQRDTGNLFLTNIHRVYLGDVREPTLEDDDGDISEAATGKNKEELERLRKQSNEIDSWASPYKAIVSVLMLKEGWDVRNVTTIVGLRAYAAQSNILPEQTLGRGLRRMYRSPARDEAGGSDAPETVSVMGTPAFMEFVESIQSEGVQLEYRPMGGGSKRQDSLVVEVDAQNPDKNLDALDIELPKLARRFNREYKDLEALDPARLGNAKLPLKDFTPEETREIVFKTMLDAEIHHTIQLDGAGSSDYRSVVGFFARQLLKDLRLVGGYDVLYPKVKTFMAGHLFAAPVALDDPVVLRNLSEPDAGKILFDAFKQAINALTVQDSGSCRIENRIRLRDTRPFRTENRPYFAPKKSLFSKIVGEPHAGGFEMAFASFLDDAPDVAAFAKNYLAVGFKIDYVKADGDLSNYVPDFLVKTTDSTVWVVETKGREERDLPQKMNRLRQWCEDASQASQDEGGPAYRFVYVDQAGYERNPPKDFSGLSAAFRDFQ